MDILHPKIDVKECRLKLVKFLRTPMTLKFNINHNKVSVS